MTSTEDGRVLRRCPWCCEYYDTFIRDADGTVMYLHTSAQQVCYIKDDKVKKVHL